VKGVFDGARLLRIAGTRAHFALPDGDFWVFLKLHV
jgi:hypothetical protein